MYHLSINNSALASYVSKLESIRKSALPQAVRQTLNDVAMDVKMNTMPEMVKKTFVNRKPTFFKANSRVEFARAGRIGQMKSIVGFIPKDKAVMELEQQEYGGRIGGRSFITTKHARVGSSWNKMVSTKSRTTAISNLVNAEDSSGVNERQKFIKAAIHAGRGGHLLHKNKAGNKKFLSQIRVVKQVRNKRLGGKMTIVKVKSLYSYDKGRSVSIRGTNFMKLSSMRSAKQMEAIFKRNAIKILNKYQ